MVDEQMSETAVETPPAADVTPKTTEKTFTQAELEAIVRERLQRERQKFADYEALKKAAEELQAIRESQKSEAEKTQEKLARLEQEYQAERDKRRAAMLQAKVVSIAGKLGAVDPQDANFIMATQSIDPDSDGADSDIQNVIEGLKATKPYLFARPGQRLEPFNPAEGAAVGQAETRAQRFARIMSGGGSIWDGDPRARGGGVVIVKGPAK